MVSMAITESQLKNITMLWRWSSHNLVIYMDGMSENLPGQSNELPSAELAPPSLLSITIQIEQANQHLCNHKAGLHFRQSLPVLEPYRGHCVHNRKEVGQIDRFRGIINYLISHVETVVHHDQKAREWDALKTSHNFQCLRGLRCTKQELSTLATAREIATNQKKPCR